MHAATLSFRTGDDFAEQTRSWQRWSWHDGIFGGSVHPKKILFYVSSFILLCEFFTANVAMATEEPSGPLDDHPEWLACASASECTSAKLGCYYWQPINKNFSSAATSVGSFCHKSNPAGPQPTVSCADHQCVNDPFTVQYWSQLESYQKFQLVMSRVEACRQASGGFSNGGDLASWTQRYEAVMDEQIRNHQFPDNQLLATAVLTVVPCAELLAWEQGQEKWQSIQSKNGSTRRVGLTGRYSRINGASARWLP